MNWKTIRECRPPARLKSPALQYLWKNMLPVTPFRYGIFYLIQKLVLTCNGVESFKTIPGSSPKIKSDVSKVNIHLPTKFHKNVFITFGDILLRYKHTP